VLELIIMGFLSVEKDTLRIIDANLNRIGEGLRVLEELARLSLDDSGLTQRLKNLRHDIVIVDSGLREKLLDARDSVKDVGADMLAEGEAAGRSKIELVTANARRAEESLRVMEEMARLPEMTLDTEKFKRARFALYTIEKELAAGLGRKEKISRITGLYAIIDIAFLEGRDYQEVTSQVIRGGARVIQLRAKELKKRDFLEIARGMKRLCLENGVLFLINDSLDIALAVDADGLHIGNDDLPADVARRLLPGDKILGCSARTVERAITLTGQGADYLGVGAMYATGTKNKAEVVGKERLMEIRRSVNIPLVAIGGIDHVNIKDIVAAGADAVAVISAILKSDDIEKATRQLVDSIEGGENG
jgi:thiamine-phosphate pyrophosphorylase